jgi:hypothetical protein
MMNYHDDFKKYSILVEEVRNAFLKEFFNSKTGVCSTGSQTAYAMPLYTGLIPEEEKEKVLNNLVDSIKKNDFALTSGDIGYHFLVRVLSENGKSDILYKMNSRTDRPGYGYQLKMGATALTESWAALSDVSNNHMMLGHLMEWFYTGLGGIYQSDNSVAYSDIIIAPKPSGNIQWVKSSYNSAKGIILSEWEIENNNFSLNIEVPPNASAKVIIPEGFRNPSYRVADVTHGNSFDVETNKGEFEISSGKYRIVSSQSR